MSCNLNIENIFNILALHNIPDFSEKVKVAFNSVNNLVPDRH